MGPPCIHGTGVVNAFLPSGVELYSVQYAVPTDCAGIVFGDERAPTDSPDVRPTLGASGLFEIGRGRPSVLNMYALVLKCGLGSDSVGLPKLTNSGEAITDHLSNGDVVSVATAVIPTVCRPELAELCAAMEPVPVDAHDISWWIGSERRSGQLADGLELLGRAPAEDAEAPTTLVGWVGEFVRQPASIAS